MDVVEVGESKKKTFLSLPGGLASWRGETTQSKGCRLIVGFFYSTLICAAFEGALPNRQRTYTVDKELKT